MDGSKGHKRLLAFRWQSFLWRKTLARVSLAIFSLNISEENGLEEELVGGAMQTVRCIAIE